MAKTRFEVLDTKTGIKLSLEKFLHVDMKDRVFKKMMLKIEEQADERAKRD